ncbi:hypothetical protein Dimus_008752 [Dionaea muscipula]
MAESAVQSAVEWLGKLAVVEVQYLYRVRDKVEELQEELKWMRCFLSDADARRHKDPLIQMWVSRIKELAYDAEDVTEKFMLRVYNKDKHRSLFSFATLKWFCSLAKDATPLHEIGSDIDTLTARMSKLSSRLQTYGVKTIYGESASTSATQVRTQELRRTYSHLEEEFVIGLEDDILILSDKLVNDHDPKMVVISGMGGLGKTTLARKLYHHSSVRKHFTGFAWAHRSQQFQTRSVILGILLHLIPDNDKQRREEVQGLLDAQLNEKLYEMLKENRYLVVLDDVWTTEDWNRLPEAFPINDVQGFASKVVLTTRNRNIVSALGELVLDHEPKFLDSKKSWELLQKKAFPDEKEDLEQLGKKMLEHCNDLPLAVVVLGGVLANKRTANDWKNVLDNIHSYFGGDKLNNNSVYDVLGMSYYDLPYHLKPCFLHLGVFPEDFEIPVKKLYRMWLAEGIVAVDGKALGGKSSVEVAEGYLNELVKRRMVQAAKLTTEGKVKTCRLHHLMRDVSMAIGREENFVSVIDHIHGQSDDEAAPMLNEHTRRLAIYLGQQHLESLLPASLSRNAPNLRSLLFFQVREAKEKSSTKFIKDICNKYRLLRVLELEGFNIRGKLPREIGNLIYLKYLNLSGTYVTSLPASIDNLMCLETLDLRRLANVKVPNILWKLKRLRHLYLPGWYEIENDKKLRLDGLSLLETLKGIDIDRVKVKGLLGLRKIREVSGRCFWNKEKMVPFLNSPSIKRLSLWINGSLFSLDRMMLSECKSLHKLKIEGEITEQLQREMFPESLVNLIFYSRTKLRQDPMPILGDHLRLLKKMIVRGLHSDVSHMVCSAAGFPELTDLVIVDCPSLVEWRMEQGAMPKLRSLRIDDTRMKKLPDALPEGINITCWPCVRGIERFGTCPHYKDALSKGEHTEQPWFTKVDPPMLLIARRQRERRDGGSLGLAGASNSAGDDLAGGESTDFQLADQGVEGLCRGVEVFVERNCDGGRNGAIVLIGGAELEARMGGMVVVSEEVDACDGWGCSCQRLAEERQSLRVWVEMPAEEEARLDFHFDCCWH